MSPLPDFLIHPLSSETFNLPLDALQVPDTRQDPAVGRPTLCLTGGA